MKEHTYIDLFSGAGGISLGFSSSCFKLLMANDIDNQALTTFRHNLKLIHPKTDEKQIIHGDITEIYKNFVPSTLFRKSNFEKYLQQLQIKHKTNTNTNPDNSYTPKPLTYKIF